MREGTVAVDPAAVLADLAAFWQNPSHDLMGRMPSRIAGGKWDQLVPEGTQNPYWEIVRQLPLDGIGLEYGFRGGRPEPDAYFFSPQDPRRLLTDRHVLCATFAWSVPSPGDVAWIRERLDGRGIVEPGAGAGYWAWQLTQAGVDVAAYEPADPADNKFVDGNQWHPVLRDDHSATAHHPDRSLLLCWPSYGEPWAAWSLAAYKGDQLFYIGEGPGGCCADDSFFSLLDAEWEDAGDCPAHVSYSGIHCYLTEYRRKS